MTFTKGHNFKLVIFCKGHQFGSKGHKFGPKVMTFKKCHKFQLVTFCKGCKFVNFPNNSQIFNKHPKKFWKGENWGNSSSSTIQNIWLPILGACREDFVKYCFSIKCTKWACQGRYSFEIRHF